MQLPAPERVLQELPQPPAVPVAHLRLPPSLGTAIYGSFNVQLDLMMTNKVCGQACYVLSDISGCPGSICRSSGVLAPRERSAGADVWGNARNDVPVALGFCV